MSISIVRSVNLATERVLGYLSLIVFVSGRLPKLRNLELRFALSRQLSAAGSSALPLVVLLGFVSGGLMLSQLMPLLGESVAGQVLLLSSLSFEVAPLLCALIVLARNSAGITSELALMRLHNEFFALERVGIPAGEYLLVPRIAGLAFAMPLLTIVLLVAAITGGVLTMGTLHGLPLGQLATEILTVCRPGMILLGLLKATVFGILIGAISCHHGAHAERSPLAVSRESINAVGRSLAAVVIVDGICAALSLVLRLQ